MGSFLWVSESFPGTMFFPNPKMPPHQDISFVTPVLFFLKPEITNHFPEFTDGRKRIVCGVGEPNFLPNIYCQYPWYLTKDEIINYKNTAIKSLTGITQMKRQKHAQLSNVFIRRKNKLNKYCAGSFGQVLAKWPSGQRLLLPSLMTLVWSLRPQYWYNTWFCVTLSVQLVCHCIVHESGKGLEIERTHKRFTWACLWLWHRETMKMMLQHP